MPPGKQLYMGKPGTGLQSAAATNFQLARCLFACELDSSGGEANQVLVRAEGISA